MHVVGDLSNIHSKSADVFFLGTAFIILVPSPADPSVNILSSVPPLLTNEPIGLRSIAM
jgi:hypothetical protein